MSHAVALVPAAGRGVRLGSAVPKALQQLRGETLLGHAVRRLAAAPSVSHVVVAAPPGAEREVRRLLHPVTGAGITVVAGGAERQASVAAALAAAPPDYEIVLVHDAARPLIPSDLCERVIDAVRHGHDAVVPVLEMVDTVKQVDSAGQVVATLERSALRRVQTPQGFRRSVLAKAHTSGIGPATDDAGLVEQLGVPVYTVPGSDWAFKITHPHDLALAEFLLDHEK